MRKTANEVSRGAIAKLPTGFGGELADVVVQRTSSQARFGEITLFAFAEGCCNISYQLMLARILAKHEGAPKVGFPLLEQRSKIQVHDIIRRNAPVRRVVIVGEQCILTAPD